MTETKVQAIATVLARLAGREMLGFQAKDGSEAVAVTKVGSVKVGTVKPPPPTTRA